MIKTITRFKHYELLSITFWLIAILNFIGTTLLIDFILGLNLFLLFGFLGLITMGLSMFSINYRFNRVKEIHYLSGKGKN